MPTEKPFKTTIVVHGAEITVTSTGFDDNDYISLTDMLKAKDGDFFISDWLRNRNTLEFLGVWEKMYNPNFNYGEFAIIKSQAGLNSYKISVKEWVVKTNAIGLHANTDAIKENLIPENVSKAHQGMTFASEADILNGW